ncbi:MAG: hypothetical protein AAF840_12020 [Bacteroidota bacterium]
MASFDPFEKEFSRRARGLRRTPSNDAWNRLERRMDGRRPGGATIFGIRPWMIAALFLIVAGVSIISKVTDDANNPLAKRAAFMEELSTPYVPEQAIEPANYLPSPPLNPQENLSEADFRDVEIAPKYRVQG